MTLTERGIASPTVSLAELLSGRRLPLDGVAQVRLADYTQEIVAAGFPGMRSLGVRASKFQLGSNVRTGRCRNCGLVNPG